MISIQKQRGMTAIGWLLVMLMVGFFLFVGIKLLPAYIDQFNVSSVLSSMKKEPRIHDMSPNEISISILKRLDINMVKDVKADDIYISQSGNLKIIEISYEVQRNIFSNVDVLLHFNNRVEVPLN